VKFQAVSAPDGLILHEFGSVEGSRHEMSLYRELNIYSLLQDSMNINGMQHCLYGDPAYFQRPYIKVGYQSSNFTADQILFNASMSKVRKAVEWDLRDVKIYFTQVDFPRKCYGAETHRGNFLRCIEHLRLLIVFCSGPLWYTQQFFLDSRFRLYISHGTDTIMTQYDTGRCSKVKSHLESHLLTPEKRLYTQHTHRHPRVDSSSTVGEVTDV
jgi:DDE superfamily endonuclease